MSKKAKQTKNQKMIYESPTSTNDELKKLGIFLLIIILLFGVFYVLSSIIDHDKKTGSTNSEEKVAVIQYDEIILGTLFSQPSENYYVLALKKDQSSLYNTYITTYKAKEEAWKIYTSDLESPFNKRYLVTDKEKSNFSLDSISDLRIKEDTLMKVEHGQITEVFEGTNEIIDQLKVLTKN